MDTYKRVTDTETQTRVKSTLSRVVLFTALTIFGITGVSSFLIAMLSGILQYKDDFHIALTTYGDGTVSSNVKISDGLAGFSPTGLDTGDRFGQAIANIGDLNGDGVTDLAVGARLDENSETSEGAMYILFMNSDGTVSSNIKISDGLAGFTPSGLDASDQFGSAVANIGDLDGDGVTDLAVGARLDENSETSEGAMYILFMNADGTVSSNVKISDGLAGFTPSGLDANDKFGSSVANIGDLDGDGVTDLAVGALDDENNTDLSEGAIYILFMNSNGTVSSNVKISDSLAGFNPAGLDHSDNFGISTANLGDLNGDGVTDLAVGAELDENIKNNEGAVYILFMNADGTVDSNIKISDGLAGFTPSGLEENDRFGYAVSTLGDLNKDGVEDLAVGARLDENTESIEGAMYILFMNSDGTVSSNVKISDGLSGFSPSGLDASDQFGSAVANIGDLNGDGVTDLAVGATFDENNEADEGALYILFMHAITSGASPSSSGGSSGGGGGGPPLSAYVYDCRDPNAINFNKNLLVIHDVSKCIYEEGSPFDIHARPSVQNEVETENNDLCTIYPEEQTVIEREQSLTTYFNSKLTEELSGYLLLQAEERGEVWYVDPVSRSRYFLPNGMRAHCALKKFGLGITDDNLKKIPIGFDERIASSDSDSDGISDELEHAIGTNADDNDTDGDGFNDGLEVKTGHNPLGRGKISTDLTFAKNIAGRIVLQVEGKGEAWYVSPIDEKRYYMKDGEAAYRIMRFLSLGITNDDLRTIAIGILE